MAKLWTAWEKRSFGLQRICTASQELCVAWVWRCNGMASHPIAQSLLLKEKVPQCSHWGG